MSAEEVVAMLALHVIARTGVVTQVAEVAARRAMANTKCPDDPTARQFIVAAELAVVFAEYPVAP